MYEGSPVSGSTPVTIPECRSWLSSYFTNTMSPTRNLSLVFQFASHGFTLGPW